MTNDNMMVSLLYFVNGIVNFQHFTNSIRSIRTNLIISQTMKICENKREINCSEMEGILLDCYYSSLYI